LSEKPASTGSSSSFAAADFASAGFAVGSDAKVKGEASGLDAPVTPVFEEFPRPPKAPTDSFARNHLPDEEPSLDYLFKPFDPGRTEEKVFELEFENLPRPKDYEYVQMDSRDTGVVRTLEMANARAKSIVGGAFEQGRRMEEKMILAAKADVDDLVAAGKKTADAEYQTLKAAAEARAAEIVKQAEDVKTEAEKLKTEAEQRRDEAERLKKEVEEKLAAVLDREAALEPREAEVEKLKAGLESERAAVLALAAAEALELKKKSALSGTEEGRSLGLAQGRSEATAEILAKAQGFFRIIERIEGLWQELWAQNAPAMVTLALEAAEAIVEKEIENGQGLAAGAFKACLDYLGKCHQVVFRVCPADLAEVEKARDGLRERLDGLVSVSFQPDPALGPGDLVMESDAGRLDATLKNRRERVMGVLRKALEDGLTAELPPPDPLVRPQAATPGADGGSAPPTSAETEAPKTENAGPAPPPNPTAPQPAPAASQPNLAAPLPDPPSDPSAPPTKPVAAEAGQTDSLAVPESPELSAAPASPPASEPQQTAAPAAAESAEAGEARDSALANPTPEGSGPQDAEGALSPAAPASPEAPGSEPPRP
jgi:flagellar biosynthesis/type III secretory pathway protein FliH